MAYLPTGVASSGLAAALNMGNSPGLDADLGDLPISRPLCSRSSSQSAQGHASRSQVKL